jgi:radical SAM PhpK family P-methyltransferase
MSKKRGLDCIVIGYNETPFDQYEELLRHYGEDSVAYRDLKLNFIDLNGRKLDYVGLLNYACNLARKTQPAGQAQRSFVSGDIPNLAAVYLTNFLKKRGLQADYINLFQIEKERLAEYLTEDPLCVAITTTFYLLNFPVNEMVQFIRRHNPRVKIVVGGPLVSNHVRNYLNHEQSVPLVGSAENAPARNQQGSAFQAALEDMGADIFVIEGQGELTLSQIVACLKTGGKLDRIPNIAYFENGEFRRTAVAPENNSLDDNVIDWRSFVDDRLGATIQTRTARSCAFKCSFCNYPTRAGRLTLAGLDTIERELDSLREIGSIKNVVFIDDTFNVPLDRFKQLCRLMIKNDYQFNWFSYFRCSNSDEEAIDLMARSGCKGVFLGIESGSPAILKNMNKAATIEKYRDGIQLLHQFGILTFGSFIIGFPGETEDTINETRDFIEETKPDYYRALIWYCEAGTPIVRERERYKIKGDGFIWSHGTMDSLKAMDYIEELFLSINGSLWLPQWSFDFWIIPYILGRGNSPSDFKHFMALANSLLAMQIAYVPEREKLLRQQAYLQDMVKLVRNW